uniref:DNA-directed RNA polymerase subunit n=1 Tax=Caulerpa racemosa TaxID=76317 RepID=A0A1I9LK71_CAURA|nr:DNA-directed RNA polymerase [Caulerpa racemosa]ANJ70732.1 DNA-directed RNA polymerase [Caulerpa racemosa]
MKFIAFRLRLGTSQLIRKWAQRQLPNGKIISGQILNPKTVNYQTLKPEKDGLFCERIFGPVDGSLCACGLPFLRGEKFCANCEVEFTSPQVRRYRLGYIQLVTAVAHVWFFKGRPNYLSLFLNLPNRKIENLLYCTQNICRTIFPKELEGVFSPKKKFIKYKVPEVFSPKINVPRFWGFQKTYAYILEYDKLEKIPAPPYIELQSSAPLPLGKAKPRLGLPKPKSSGLSAACLSCGIVLRGILRPRRLLLLCQKCRTLSVQSKPMLNSFLTKAPTCPAPERFTIRSPARGRLPHSQRGFLARRGSTKKNSFFIPPSRKALGGIFFYKIPQRKSRKTGQSTPGLRDSALFFSFSIVPKMFSWNINHNWFDFVYFVCHFPKKGDLLNKYYPGPPGFVNFCPLQSRLYCFTGAQLIKTWLSQLTKNDHGRLLEIQLRIDLLKLDLKEPLLENEFVQKINLLRRFKYLRSFRHKKMNPASMIISVLPVLPPDLRPIVKLDGSKIAVSDLNKLYQYVILRNRRLWRLTRKSDFHCLNSEAFQYTQRLLQESVDNLIENKSGGSLSDLFKGKKGRFRQNLLGKRVDYSGRSVIVVGPFLKIYECGIPREIAYELFQPFLIRSLISQKKAHTIFGAKKLLTSLSQEKPFLWNLLKKIVEKHPLLLNRAPTLHRLSVQAFLPRLVEGRAILLHPLVCSPFNADFDGDQMGVHIPLCFEARGEAWKLMWSQNNLFSVATGNPVFSPSQDMILGSCFLTTKNTQQYCFSLLNIQKNFQLWPKSSLDFLFPYSRKEKPSEDSWSNNLKPIWISQNPFEIKFETDITKQKLIEIRINIQGQSIKFRSHFCQHFHPSGTEIFRHIRTTYGRLKFHQNVL